MSRYAAVIKRWQTGDLSSEEYQETVEGVAEMSNSEVAAIFRTPKHDHLREHIREEIIVRSLLGAAWQKALTWIAIVLGAASSLATIRDAFRERPASPAPPTTIRESASHTEAASAPPQLTQTNPFSTARPFRLSRETSEESGSTQPKK